MKVLLHGEDGQSTVEAALFLPLFLLLLLLLCQPAILLYERVIMEDAAAQGCRLLATRMADEAGADEKYEAFVRRRLAAIPQADIFHVHGEECSYTIELEGNENSAELRVCIENKLKPLPLIDVGMRALGLCDEDGYVVLRTELVMPGRPEWSEQEVEDWSKQWE